MNGGDYVCQSDTNVAGVVRLRFVDTREREYMPSQRFQHVALRFVPDAGAFCVVPVSTVVLDGQHRGRESEINIVLIDGQQRGRLQPGRNQRIIDDRFVATQSRGALLPDGAIAQIRMRPLRAANPACCVSHQRRAFVVRQRPSVRRIAVVRTEQPFGRVFHHERDTANHAGPRTRRGGCVFHLGIPAITGTKPLRRVSRPDSKCDAASGTRQCNRHTRIIAYPNGSLVVTPILTTPLGE